MKQSELAKSLKLFIGLTCIILAICGFVINKEKATASDVYRLIQEVQQEVYRQFGVKLETEVKMVGDFR